MKWSCILLLIIFSGFISRPPESVKPSVICTLTADKQIYKQGEVPKFNVTITNKGRRRILMIGCLDGSAQKVRRPWCGLMIKKPKEDTVNFGLCKTSNPLRTQDFVWMNPGESFDPFQSVDQEGFFTDFAATQKETFRNPGNYTVQFYYSSASTDIKHYISNTGTWGPRTDSNLVKKLFQQCAHVEVLSNTIELKFETKNP